MSRMSVILMGSAGWLGVQGPRLSCNGEGEFLPDGKLRLIHLCGNIDVLLLGVDGRYHRDNECRGEDDAGEGASYGQGMWHVFVYQSFSGGGSGETRTCCRRS